MSAYLPNLKDLIAAGIDPTTGLPIKFVSGRGEYLLPSCKRLLRIMDEQAAVNSFYWSNLPEGLTGEFIERVLYYRGKGILFYLEPEKRFYFLPCCLADGLTIEGKWKKVRAIPFFGGTDTSKVEPINNMSYTVQYDVQLQKQEYSDMLTKAVMLFDYTPQYTFEIIPRQQLQEAIINTEAEVIPFLRTKLLTGSGVKGLRVTDASEVEDVKDLARGVYLGATEGEPYVAIRGQNNLDLTEIDGSSAGMRSEDYLMAMQSLDNIRLSFHGLDNGGIFEKKAHITNAELAMNAPSVGMVYQDRLAQRQKFCDIVNSLWGLNVNVEPSETVLGMDMNGDGIAADNAEASVSMEGNENAATI